MALRGNVDTRLRKLGDGAADALVLAHAGLERLGRTDEAGARARPESFVPAPGQGALALEARADDDDARAALARCTIPTRPRAWPPSARSPRALGGRCHTPLGAHAAPAAGVACACAPSSACPTARPGCATSSRRSAGEPERLGREVAARLLAAGARELLDAAEAAALSAAGSGRVYLVGRRARRSRAA